VEAFREDALARPVGFMMPIAKPPLERFVKGDVVRRAAGPVGCE
jgi:hypothetical protein